MYRKFLGKSKRIAAIVLAGAMIFGSMTAYANEQEQVIPVVEEQEQTAPVVEEQTVPAVNLQDQAKPIVEEQEKTASVTEKLADTVSGQKDVSQDSNTDENMTTISEEEAKKLPVETTDAKAGTTVESIQILDEKDHVEVPAKLKIQMDIAGAIEDVDQIDLYWWNQEKEANFGIEVQKEDIEINGTTCTFTIDIPKEYGKGLYKLKGISIWADFPGEYYGILVAYYFDNSSGKFESEQDTDGLEYRGNADFTITDSQFDDTIDPRVVSVKRLTDGLHYTNREIKYEIGVVENESGIKRAQLQFKEKENDSVLVFYQTEPVEVGADSVIVTMEENPYPGTYELDSIVVEDKAGHNVGYWREEDGKFYGYEGNDLVELNIVEEVQTIELLPASDAVLKITDMKIEEGVDLKNLKAGDSFQTTLTFRNDSDKAQNLSSSNIGLWWSSEDESVGEITNDTDYKKVKIEPGETCDFTFTTEINKYTKKGSRELEHISYSGTDEEGVWYRIHYHVFDKKYLIGMNDENKQVHVIPYAGELDYNVTVAEEFDGQAPLVESITVKEELLKAPGPLTLQIKMKSQEVAPLDQGELEFVDTANPKNRISVGINASEVEYDEGENTYIAKAQLNNTILKGTYKLESCWFTDAAHLWTGYFNEEDATGLLTTDKGDTLEPIILEIKESETEDRDFTAPTMHEVEWVNSSNEIEASEDLQLRLKATDDSGISYVILSIESIANNSFINIKSSEMKKEGDFYECKFPIGKYTVSGEYIISAISVCDDSIRKNLNDYFYNEGTNVYEAYSTEEYPEVPVEGSMRFHVIGSETVPKEDYIVTNIEEAVEEVEKADKGATIVLQGVDALKPQELPTELVAQIKEKELTLIVPSSNSTSEVKVIGKDIKDENLTLGISQEAMVENKVVVGGEEKDMYYPVTVTTSTTDMPITLSLKLGSKFLEESGNKGITLSRTDAPGVLAENLSADENGYIHVTLDSGWKKSVSMKSARESSDEQKVKFIVSAKKQAANVPLVSIIPEKDALTLVEGDVKTIGYKLNPENTTEKTIRFTSVDPEIADVSEEGVVTAKKAGETTILLSGANNVKAEVKVTVEGKSVEEEYKPSASLTSGTWTGKDDIVIKVQGKGGTVNVAEIYYYKNEASIGGIKVKADIQVDTSGNGTITFKKDALMKAAVVGESSKVMDWTKADQIEVVVLFEHGEESKFKSIYVPVDYKGDSEKPGKPAEQKPENIIKNPNKGQELSDKVVEQVVEAVESAKKDSKVVVKMNGATTVPKETLEALKGKDVNLVLDMGKYSWTINGKDVTADTLKDTNLKVTIGSNEIPEKLVDKVANGNETIQISLAHDGAFGFKADLKLSVGAKNKGKNAKLYYYNEDGKLEFVRSVKVASDGTVVFTLEYASDYVVVLEKKSDTTPKTGDTSPLLLYVCMMLLAGGVVVFVGRRRCYK